MSSASLHLRKYASSWCKIQSSGLLSRGSIYSMANGTGREERGGEGGTPNSLRQRATNVLVVWSNNERKRRQERLNQARGTLEYN